MVKKKSKRHQRQIDQLENSIEALIIVDNDICVNVQLQWVPSVMPRTFGMSETIKTSVAS